MTPGIALAALTVAAVGVDLVAGDPRAIPHPVVLMGRIISALEARLNRGTARARRFYGLATVLITVGGTLASVWLLCRLLTAMHPWLGLAVELWLVATTLAIKGLEKAGRAVASPLARGDLAAARHALSQVVGRDTATLDEAGLTRGAVETVAENTVDGITAPLFFALLGGAPLALAYKAINTLDSMLGYQNARFADFGFVAAKLDDVANWLPARLTGLCLWGGGVLLNAAGAARLGWRGALPRICRDAPKHLSPNAGWPEAAVAHLLGIQLGGTSTYQGRLTHRATLGRPLVPPSAAHIGVTIRLMHAAWGLFFLLSAGLIIATMWLIKAGGIG